MCTCLSPASFALKVHLFVLGDILFVLLIALLRASESSREDTGCDWFCMCVWPSKLAIEHVYNTLTGALRLGDLIFKCAIAAHVEFRRSLLCQNILGPKGG
jgi:hypothetical protein